MARSSQYRLRRHRPGHQHPKLHGQCWAKMLRAALARRSSAMDALGSDLSDYAMAWPRAAALRGLPPPLLYCTWMCVLRVTRQMW